MPRRGPRLGQGRAKVLFFEQKLKCGFQWTRLPPFFFRDTMKFPAVYAQVFLEAVPAIPRENVGAVRTPVVNCAPGALLRGDDKCFAHYKMIQDHLLDKWTLHGTSQQFDTLLASIPDAIMMTQKTLVYAGCDPCRGWFSSPAEP